MDLVYWVYTYLLWRSVGHARGVGGALEKSKLLCRIFSFIYAVNKVAAILLARNFFVCFQNFHVVGEINPMPRGVKCGEKQIEGSAGRCVRIGCIAVDYVVLNSASGDVGGVDWRSLMPVRAPVPAPVPVPVSADVSRSTSSVIPAAPKPPSDSRRPLFSLEELSPWNEDF
jgi:hypothetical protein